MILFALFAKLYRDYAATTPCHPEVVMVMNRILRGKPGNPNAEHHYGRMARVEILKAEETLKKAVNGNHVLWTSGATEANNIAILCVKKPGIIVTCATEHKSVLESVKKASTDLSGLNSTPPMFSGVVFNASKLRHKVLPVDCDGAVDMKVFEDALKSCSVKLVSMMFINNETGYRHDIKEIGRLCHKHGVLFHVDAVQAFGKTPINMKENNIDMLTISGHKIYGPQGIGALILSEKGLKAIEGSAFMNGGALQFGVRSGTLPTALCVGLGAACELAHKNMKKNAQKAASEKEILWKEIKKRYPKAEKNCDSSLPYILSIRIPKEGKINPAMKLSKKYLFSEGSACSTGKGSHVMEALGVDQDKFHVLRFSFGE